MLARYKMYRGQRPPDDPLPDGVRMDTRKHTRHCLRPTAEIVQAYLSNPTEDNWRRFASEYRMLIASRFNADRTPFDNLYQLALTNDVFIGCSCPTKANPDVRHCHTVLALTFMQEQYPDLDVRFDGVNVG